MDRGTEDFYRGFGEDLGLTCFYHVTMKRAAKSTWASRQVAHVLERAIGIIFPLVTLQGT